MYVAFIRELKSRIINSRYQAARLVNREQLLLYYETGKSLSEKIAANNWGAKIIDQIAEDIQKELSGLRGFSRRNLLNMRRFYEAYADLEFVQLATAQLQGDAGAGLGLYIEAFFSIGFTHHALLLTKCKDLQERIYYMNMAAKEYWAVSVLQHHIEASLYQHQGKLPNNFAQTLPEAAKESAQEMFRDEYLLDFIRPAATDGEREIENKVMQPIRDLILRIGRGFCFIGNQYRMEVGGEEFFADLVFFNRILRCMVVIELKNDRFRPAYAGQLNFYLNVLNDREKLPDENPAIGIILCKDKSNTVVEFAIKNIDGAMGVATYRTTRRLPEGLKGIFPDPDDLTSLL